MAVVLYHYSFRGNAADHLSTFSYPAIAPVAKYGYLGVNLFFIISGFVILMTAWGATSKDFFVSRAVRLYPAFWVCCTLTFVVTLIAGHGIFIAHLGQYLTNMTLLAGFSRIPLIDGVYWSLVVEIQFYALVFVVLLSGHIDKAERLFAAWLVVTGLLLRWPVHYATALFLVQFAPYFVAGATFFLIRREGWSTLRTTMLIASYATCLQVALVESVALRTHFHTEWNPAAIAAILASFFGIFALIASKRTSVFARDGFIALGALTYPLYLIHQNVGFMLLNALHGRVNDHVSMWGTVALMLLIAFAVNRWIERRSSKWLKRQLHAALSLRPMRPSLPQTAEAGEA